MTKQESDCLRDEIRELLNEENSITTELYASNVSTFSCLLENFVHLEFTEKEAIHHWKKIIENSKSLKEKLGRKIGVHLAIVDYFTNIKHLMNSPMLIEIHVFRQTERLAMIDGLTGVFNRRYMDIVLKKEFNRCERYGKDLSVCILDIDNFKIINDTKGHLFGDEVLKELSNVLKTTVREEDIVCRYGGEEFLLVLPETDAPGARILANRIRLDMKNSPFFMEHKVTFSAGTATYPGSAFDIDTLIKAADRAMYQAKFTGKDCIVEATPERRKSDRYPQTWTLDIYPDSSSEPITGITTQNVSVGGMQFECPVRYAIDTALHLVFTDSDTDSGITNTEADGRITWVKKSRNSYFYGVSFLVTPDLIESRLVSHPQTVNEVI